MAAQSGSVVSSACLLLLVLLPLTLAQDDCYRWSPNWPDCLPNRLNGTYYIRPEGSENTSCPAQIETCPTLAQLRDDFFVTTYGGQYDTATNGMTSLVFLPGMHTLDYAVLFIGNQSSFSLTGRNNSMPAIINCNNFNRLTSGGFQDITITHLQFHNCIVLVYTLDVLVVDYVVFYDAGMGVQVVADSAITNSIIKLVATTAPDFVCSYITLGVFNIVSSHTRLRNVTFTLLSDPLPCDDGIFLGVHDGDLDIADSAFLGKPNAKHIILSNTTLTVSGTVQFENGNTAIQALKSIVNLEGNVSFINNTAYQGGAMSLTDSRVSIADNAHVIFQRNHADHVGGAIFSTGNDISNYISVGSRADVCQISFGVNSSIEFIENTAERGGSAIYGITVSKLVCGRYSSDNPYDALFDILPIELNSSAVSSDPLRVCMCPGDDQSTPDCLAVLPDQNDNHLHYTVYPGQNFTIPAAVVGFNFALTSGPVWAQFFNSDASLGLEFQYVQGVSHTGCAPLQYSVLSDKKQETLVLTANGRSVAGIPNGIERDIQVLNENTLTHYDAAGYPTSSRYFNPTKYYYNNTFAIYQTDGVFQMAGYVPRQLQDTPVFVNLTLLDCPPGFTLSDRPHKCECNERLRHHSINCNINDQTVRRNGTTWIDASFTGNSSHGVIVHLHCPFGYCKQDPVDVNLINPDTQCAFNHSGILCGACKSNFSLALGSSRCLPKCSLTNSYLSLLFPFVLAGFALVFFIKILNLTVSQGTINGLLFYANIVAANRSIFFPAQYRKFLSILSVFISWLNLDLGIETCFIKGLDGYWKTWLQFVFPFYVWTIAGAIILVSHYSTRATKIFGKNSLSVLATLFLLSYAKLLRSIITIFSFTTLVYPDDSTREVWAFDGNVKYLSPKHIPLFLFAIAFVLLLWLPYTAVLLSAQWLRTQTHRKGLRWLKPFLDAYYGPFKDKHHYWVGVLLVVRGVLFVCFASFFAIESNVNLLLVIVSSVSLSAFPGSLYKVVYLTALENSFFINLGVLAAGTFYIKLVGGSQEALVTTSVVIAFLQFIGITVFHSYHFVIVPLGKKWKANSEAEDQSYDIELKTVLGFKIKTTGTVKPDEDSNVITHSEVRLSELRREAAQLSPENLEPHAEPKILPSKSNTPGNNTPRANTNQPSDPTATEHRLQQAKANRVHINDNTTGILIPFAQDTPLPNIDPPTAANEAAGAPKKSESESEAAAVPSNELLLPQESKEPPRHCVAKRESIPYNADNFREPWLEIIHKS